MAINSQKLLPTSAIIKWQKQEEVNEKKEKKANTSLKKELLIIRKNLISIDKILRKDLLLYKKTLETQRKIGEKQKFRKKEQRLEKKPEKELEKEKEGGAPQLGIFDRINRFITFTFLGWLTNKLFKYIPQLLDFTKKIVPVVQFFESFIGNTFKGIVDFIDFGYDTHEKVKKFAKNIGGENFEKTFDDFSRNLNTFINLAIVAGMATMGGTDFGLGKKGGKPGPGGIGGRSGIGNYLSRDSRVKLIERKYGNNAARMYEARVAQGGSRERALADVRKRFSHLEHQGGLKGGTGPGKVFGRGFGNAGSRFTTKLLGKAGKRLAGRVFGRIPIIGGLVDFLFALWSGEPIGRAAAKGVGATIGSALGTFVPVPFAGTILGGILGDIVGGALYDTLVGNRPEEQQIKAKAKGGQVTTRKGKVVGGAIRRTVRKTTPSPKAIPPQPGKSVGGKNQLQKMFPEPQGQQVGKSMSPYGFLNDTVKTFADIPFLGSLFNIFGKVIFGDLPSKTDYQNVGLGINAWINNAISLGLLQGNLAKAFADGGIVDGGMTRNISGWVEKSLEDLIKNKVTEAINNLKRNLGLEPLQESSTERGVTGTSGELAEGTVPRGQISIEQLVGLAKGAGFSQSDAVIMAAIAMAESGGDSNAHNAKPPDNSYGLWQINMLGPLQEERFKQIGISNNEQLKDPVINAHAAKVIKQRQGFTAWSVYKSGKYKAHIAAAQKSANAPAITVYRSPTSGGFVPMGTEQGNLQSARELASSMGLTMTSGQRGPRFPGDKSLHISGRAMDFSNVPAGTRGSAQMDKFAQEMIKKYGGSLKQLIYTPLGFGISNKKRVDLSHWGEGTNNAHYDHVHVAFKGGGSVGPKNTKNINSLRTQASYDRKVLAIQPIIIEKPIPMLQQSSSISFIGGGVNSNDNKSLLFVG